MKTDISIESANKYARITGWLYLLIIACGMSSEVFVRARLIVWDNEAETVANIIANPMLFRVGFVSDLVMVICDVAVALTFYILLKHVNNVLASLAAIFRLMQSSILGMNLLNYYQPVLLLQDDRYSNDSAAKEINAQVMMYLHAHNYGYLLALVFFALSCIVLGYLLYKSPLFPGILGILLVIAAFGYLIDSFTNFLFPEYSMVTEWIVLISALIAEVGLCLWLLVKGVKNPG